MALSENWARATVIARPWPNSSSPRETKRHLHVAVPADISMNGADEPSIAIHAFELETQQSLSELLELKRKMKRAALGPFEIMRSVFQKLHR